MLREILSFSCHISLSLLLVTLELLLRNGIISLGTSILECITMSKQ